MRHNGIRISALLLAICLLIGILPFGALAADDTQTQVVGQQLFLGDDLTMHFYVQVNEQHKADGIMQVEVGGKLVADYEIGQMTANEAGNYDFSVALGAPQMTEKITLRLICGEQTVLEKTYSIREYALYILNGKYTNETKALVKGMLNYGAAAQIYFDHNTQDLANAGYEQTAPAVTGEAATVELSGSVNGINYHGSSLGLQSKVAVYHYFSAPNGVDGYTFRVNNNVCAPIKAQDGLYYIEVTGINPQDMGAEMTVSVTDGTDTMSYQYNPVSYITRMYNKETTSTQLKNLLAAANSYFTAAQKFDGVTSGDISLQANGDHVYPISETPRIHFSAQTTLNVSAVKTGVSPRVGLRLTNNAGNTLDFVIAYHSNGTFWDYGYYVFVTENGEETSKWYDLTDQKIDQKNVTLKIEKIGDTLNFYVDGTLALTNTYAGFGVNDPLTASLYSRYSDTQFTDYSVEALEVPDATVNASNHTFVLNETPLGDLVAETTLTVSEVLEGVSPRTGLRLTNEAGVTLDYVLAYKTDTALWTDWLLIAIAGKDPIWIELSAGALPTDDLATLMVRKAGNDLHFYLNGTWVKTLENEAGFGADNRVTAALYSKYAATDFAAYSAQEVAAADAILEDGTHQYLISDGAYQNLSVQTTLSVSAVKNGIYAHAGLRLTNAEGKTLDLTLGYNNNTAFWPDGYYITETGKASAWKNLDKGILSTDKDVILEIEKVGNTLNIYINNTLALSGSFEGFGIYDQVTAHLYSKHTDTKFSSYSVTQMHPENSVKESGNHMYALNDAAATDLTVETRISVSEVQNGVYPRVGLRLMDESGAYLDYVIAYDTNMNLWNYGYYVVVVKDGADVTKKWYNCADSKTFTDADVTLKIVKVGSELHFYIDGVEQTVASSAYADFSAGDAVTAYLYSKNATVEFTDYSAS